MGLMNREEETVYSKKKKTATTNKDDSEINTLGNLMSKVCKCLEQVLKEKIQTADGERG